MSKISQNPKKHLNFINSIFITIIIFVIVSFPLDYLKGFGYTSVCLNEGFKYMLTTFGWGLQSACFEEIENNLLQILGGVLAVLVASMGLVACTFVKWYKPGIVASITFVIGFSIEVIVHSIFINWHTFNQYVIYLSFFVFSIIFGVMYWKIPSKKDWQKSHRLIGNIIIVMMGSIASIIVLYVNFEIPNATGQNDFPNWLTLVVEVTFGIIITLIVYEKTTSSSEYMKEKIGEIRRITGQTKEANDEKAKTAIIQIKNYFEGIKKNIKDLNKYLDTYNSYPGEINEEYSYDYHDLATFEYNYMQKEIQSIKTTVELSKDVLKIQDAQNLINFCDSFKELEINKSHPYVFEVLNHLIWLDDIKKELEKHVGELENNDK